LTTPREAAAPLQHASLAKGRGSATGLVRLGCRWQRKRSSARGAPLRIWSG